MSAATTPTTAPASRVQGALWLRRFLALDALVTGANGLAYAAASGPLGRFLGVDPGLLLELGVLLLAYGVGVAALAARGNPPVLGVRTVIEINLVWTVLSLVALFAWLSPSAAGTVWAVLQAAVVAGFAALQNTALRATR
ncbi:hypothetical protein [Streptomyces sp. VRA16 Mangrove soil]|uniref:hypothetical protein n=1 Tax=Streptomyces sp. VRA16 Mangrove soil TaxID=2817434 RepID=UPI001A9F73C4|nr:hypothetical protein [Streptomyces sp. VRA16 Mangrove soil]MBO1331061.1 hypothetical protein [Streptomyces sp. VRA16 Mangrove soil]